MEQRARSRVRVLLLITSFEPHDAIGNDVLLSYHALRRAGYQVSVFAGSWNAAYASIAAEARVESDEWDDPRAILIYHHSIAWPAGEKILARSKNKIVVKYHNVTPPEYFASYARRYYLACMHGLEASGRLAKSRIDFLWGDSQFNAEEFIRLGVRRERCRVMPPMHRVEEMARAPLDAVITGAYRDGVPNILFVGAFRPNKGHFRAIETLAAYRRLSSRPARLFLPGSLDPALNGYVEDLKQHAASLEVSDGLFLAPSATLSQLRAYYTAASVFLCVSRHEGFCVPLVEAMYFRVPIVAWATTAVGETCGGCGMVFDDYDAGALAAGIDECVGDPGVARRLADQGRQRYEKVFCPEALATRLLALTEEVESL
jgi:glycosyltransferase involved in cell wall biosynthesis